MITKVIFICALTILQNIFLINSLSAAQKYVEVDKIVAIVETQTITNSELNKKKEKIRKALSQQEGDMPSDKKITKLSLDQLIVEKLVFEYTLMQGISVSEEQLNNVMNGIAKSNNISIEELIKEIEMDGTRYSDFREDIRIRLLFDQVKKRIIGANLKISKFEIDNFIELQKERTPTKYNYSHIFIEYIKNNDVDVDVEKTKIKLTEVVNKLKERNFDDVAINYSDGPMAKKGGLIGSKIIDEIPDIFIESLKSMKIGEISQPINGSGGFHLIKLNQIEEFEMETIVVSQSKAKQILLKKNQIVSEDEIKKKLNYIRNLIIEGMSFSEAAEKYSEDGSAASKGDLGWLSPGDTIPEFEIEMDNLELNEISQPIKTALGWHLIQVNERREKDLSSESLRQKVKDSLLKQKTDIKFNDWIKTLKEGAHIEIWLYEN
ncbi:MAG: peptidylprolyl isomerase [Methylophilaceae bacterium]|nr:peptidylprolyl isomerase [Methylophilaceae bacterium]